MAPKARNERLSHMCDMVLGYVLRSWAGPAQQRLALSNQSLYGMPGLPGQKARRGRW